MISIIICSRTQNISFNLSENIKNTIGYAYELIVIDNAKNKYSIFEAYNLGIKKCKGEYWCFMHDDIFIHTDGWGTIINHIFNENPDVGLIGVAGAKIKTKMPSAWWDCPEDQKVINIIQHFPNRESVKWQRGFEKEQNVEVVAIDGVFMVGKRDSAIGFDERLEGFHNYDLYLSLTYHLNRYKVVVTQNILLEHFSLGVTNKSWFESTLHFDALFKNVLPLKVENAVSTKQLKIQEFKNGMYFCSNLVHYYKTYLKISLSFF